MVPTNDYNSKLAIEVNIHGIFVGRKRKIH